MFLLNKWRRRKKSDGGGGKGDGAAGDGAKKSPDREDDLKKKNEEKMEETVVVVDFRGISVQVLVDIVEGVQEGTIAEEVDLVVASDGRTLRLIEEDENDESKAIVRSPFTVGDFSISKSDFEAKKREDWSTEDISQYVVLPACAERRCIYLDLYNDGQVSLEEYKGTFVSQARKQRFSDMVGALATHFEEGGKDLKNSFVWLDLFCANQPLLSDAELEPKVRDATEKLLREGLHTALQKFDDLVIFLGSWDGPAPLTRAWCIWEIYGALKGEKKFEVLLNAGEQERFLDSLRAGSYRGVLDSIIGLDGASATCFREEDLQLIRNAVAELERGWVNVNAAVKQELARWLQNSLESYINDKREKLEEKGEDASPEEWLDLAGIQSKGAQLIIGYGGHQKAMKFLQGAIESNERLGVEDFGFFNRCGFIFYEMGWCLQCIGDLNNSENTYKRSIESFESAISNANANDAVLTAERGLILAEGDLGLIMEKKGDYEEAVEILESAVEKYTKFGPSAQLSAFLHGLGGPLMSLKRYEKAEEYLLRALEMKRQVYPPKHPSLATTLNDLVITARARGRPSEARVYAREALDISIENIGEETQMTVLAQINLTACMQECESWDEASLLAEATVALALNVLGEEHQLTKLAKIHKEQVQNKQRPHPIEENGVLAS